MDFHLIVTLLVLSVTIATCYKIGRSENQPDEGRNSWEGDFPEESHRYLELPKATAFDNYINAFFGNTGDRVSSRSPQGASVGNHLKTTSESYRKLNSNYVRHPGQRADFGTYDLFRFQVEGNQYNPHVYYRHPLPKSRTNLPGFAQKVVFEDELPLITRIPHRFRDF